MVRLERLEADDVPDAESAVARSDLDLVAIESGAASPSSFDGAVAPPRQITAVVGVGMVGRFCGWLEFGSWPVHVGARKKGSLRER